MGSERHVRLFRNGRNQAVRIPEEFEMEGIEAIIRKEGNRLILEPVDAKKPFGRAAQNAFDKRGQISRD